MVSQIFHAVASDQYTEKNSAEVIPVVTVYQ